MNKFIKCLSAILCGVGALFAVSKVNAYELDSNNNIVSSNLVNINDYEVTDGGSKWVIQNIQLPTSTISLSFEFDTISNSNSQMLWYFSDSQYNDFPVYTTGHYTQVFENITGVSSVSLYSNAYVYNLKIMCNYGSTILPYEPYGTWYNENYLRMSRMGILSNLDYLQPYINNQSFNEYSINDLFNDGLITNDNSINLISINNDVNTSYEPITFDFYLNDYILKSQFKLAFSRVADINAFTISGYNAANPNRIYSYTLSINELPTYFDLTDYETNNIDYINYFSIFFNSADQVVNINGNIDYYNGYNAGLEVANRWQDMYNEISSSYNSLQQQYNDLLRQYNNYINGNVTLDTLIWNIATTPFETFKTIWDVDILGVNLGSLCVGLMFVGIALYIWRKFI